MTPSHKLKIAHLNQDALGLFEQMNELNIAQVPVIEGENVIGMLDRDSLVRFMQVRNALRA